MTSNKVAIITGGASGFGLAVGSALVERGGWRVHLFDRNEEPGEAACSTLGAAANFHHVDVAEWRDLSEAFHEVFTTERRIDFVFGNAGISPTYDFYERHPADQIPPEPDLSIVDINLKAVYTTSYLALHYFRQSPPGDKSLVLTASVAGLYPGMRTPTYCGTKHGIVGFMRSIARDFAREGIRCNAICPGAFLTNIVDEATMKAYFPAEGFGSVSYVAEIVLQLIDGSPLVDAFNHRAEKIHGQTLEIIVDKFYLREQPPFSNPITAKIMGVRDMTKVNFML